MMETIYASAVKVTVFLDTATAVDYDVSDIAAHQLQKNRKSVHDHSLRTDHNALRDLEHEERLLSVQRADVPRDDDSWSQV